MHTTIYRDKTKQINFYHHGDFSGDIMIQCDSRNINIQLPFEALKFLVGEYVRSIEISRIEDSSTNDLLGILD